MEQSGHAGAAVDAIWRALEGAGGRAVLESAAPGPGTGRWSIVCAAPQGRIVWRDESVVLLRDGAEIGRWSGDPFDGVRAALDVFRAERPVLGALPFAGGAVGWFSYELGRRLERAKFPAPRADVDPPLELALYGGAILIDHENEGAITIAAIDTAFATAKATQAILETAMHTPAPSQREGAGGGRATSAALPSANAAPYSATSEQEHARAVSRIRSLIEQGDLYQANYSVRFSRPCPAPTTSTALWERLRATAPEPFSACLEATDRAILCASMERLLSVRPTSSLPGGHAVETRPIKGTRPRSPDPSTDARAKAELAASEKDRAELLMIVDLHRNDLGKVCVPGSIEVPTLYGVRTFARVHHLEATVRGALRPTADALDALRAVFPAGSITGAPKIRAMQVIEEVEPSPRGVYCGAIGYLGLDGSADFAVAIRTAVLQDQTLRWSAGGGIVWDSTPSAEWHELLAKAANFAPP